MYETSTPRWAAIGLLTTLLLLTNCAPGGQGFTKALSPLETQLLVAATTKAYLISHPATPTDLAKLSTWLNAAQTNAVTSDRDLAAHVQSLADLAPAGWNDLISLAIVMFAERSGALELARQQKNPEAMRYLDAIFLGIRSVVESERTATRAPAPAPTAI